MGIKQENEITLKIKCRLDEFYNTLEKKQFKIIDRFLLQDTFFIPTNLEIEKKSIREILASAVLLRYIRNDMYKREAQKMTYKYKNIDENGNILEQRSFNCNIDNIEDGKNFLGAIGYKQIMTIKENDVVYEKDGFAIAVKDIENGDKLIEVETNEKFDSINKLIEKINEYEIPVYTDDYFVKKAEIELEKVLKNNKTKIEEYIGQIVKVKIDRPLNSKHPKHGFIYPVNYGFVPNTISGDGEELDCYVLGIDEPIEEFEGKCIAVIHRTNDNDDKLIIVPEGKEFTDEEIKKLTNFQEQYFESEIIR